MLWYKSWLETRSRFLLSLLNIVALCSFSVNHGNEGAMPYTKLEYYFAVLHGGHSMLCMLWVLAVTLLAMGGLLREKAVGTAPFTLALPVSRARLIAVRISVVLGEAMALVIVPWMAMFLIGTLNGKTHSVQQAFFHMVLLAGGGVAFLGAALLISSLVEGEYTAPLVSFGVLIGISVLLSSSSSLQVYSPIEFIRGTEFLDRHTRLLTGPIPWMRVGVNVLIGSVLVALSAKSVQARDF
jgi:ABC-2 type transport system permease protein